MRAFVYHKGIDIRKIANVAPMWNPFERKGSQQPTQEQGVRPEAEPSAEEVEKKKPLTALDRFRKGRFGTIGRALGLVAAFSVPEALVGRDISSKTEAASVRKEITEADLAALKTVAPDVIDIGAHDIWMGYGGSKEQLSKEGAVEKEVVVSETATISTEVPFTWGGREFKDAKFREQAMEHLKASVRPRLEQLLAPYKEFGLTDSAIDRIRVQGDVFSSPEGFEHPQANQELSEKRAAMLQQAVAEILMELHFEGPKVQIEIGGKGAQGDLMEMSNALERLGYKFKSGAVDPEKKDPLSDRKKEIEAIIAHIHDGNIDSVLKHIPEKFRDPELLTGIYENTIASKRVGRLKLSVDTKSVHLGVHKDAPNTEETTRHIQEFAKPEEEDQTLSLIIRITEEGRRPTEGIEEAQAVEEEVIEPKDGTVIDGHYIPTEIIMSAIQERQPFLSVAEVRRLATEEIDRLRYDERVIRWINGAGDPPLRFGVEGIEGGTQTGPGKKEKSKGVVIVEPIPPPMARRQRQPYPEYVPNPYKGIKMRPVHYSRNSGQHMGGKFFEAA
jgi:signal recognition particle subunit SEC65